MVLGDIPRDTVLSMIDKYKKEQTKKSAQLNELTEKLNVSKEMDNDIKAWVKLIKGCTNIETIDRELMIKLIDKIIVGQKTIVDGVAKQDITIVYNLLGEEVELG
ncbi:MAG: DUF4368 domain-containing protein [Clostridia bacterium]